MAKVTYKGDSTGRTTSYRIRRPGQDDIVLRREVEGDVADDVVVQLREVRGHKFAFEGEEFVADDATPDAAPELDELTVEELEKVAKDHSVKVKRNASKDELLEALLEAGIEATTTTEDPEGVNGESA